MISKLIIAVIIFVCSFNPGKAQIHETVDSVVQEICKSFNEQDDVLDSVIVTNIFIQHLSKYISTMSREAGIRTMDRIDVRLQATCQKYVDYVGFQNTDWVRVKDCPRSEISDIDLKQFFTIGTFRYVEGNGDTTTLKLTQSEWVDYMKDGTYSKLSLKMLSPADFVIQFVESNNLLKAAMSKMGDKYYYSIISKGKNFYTLCVSVPNLRGGTLFKVYYK